MQQHDYRRLVHIRDYCCEILSTVDRYGNDFEIFNNDIIE